MIFGTLKRWYSRVRLRFGMLVSIGLSGLLPLSLLAQAGAQTFTMESAGPPRESIPLELRNHLGLDGTRLLWMVNGIEIPVAELWWVKDLKIRRPENNSDANYGYFKTGQSLGVLYLPGAINDVRLHKVPPGLYTLRYGKPNGAKKDDDDAERVRDEVDTEYQDYVFLTPLQSGGKSASLLGHQSTRYFSRQTSQKKEAAALLALPPPNPAYQALPAVVSDDLGHCAVQFEIPVHGASTQMRTLRISILLVNPPDLSEDD